MSLNVLTPPTLLAIDRERAKNHCSVYHNDQDTVFDDLIKAAQQYVEADTLRTVLTTVYTLTLDCFPSIIRLPRPPIASVASIVYVDSAGTSQTLAASNYQTDTTSSPGRIAPAHGCTWPATQSRLNAVTVTYTAGWATAASVPESIKAAMVLLVAHWFENRSAVLVGSISKPLEFTVDALLSPYKLIEYA